MKKRRAGPSRRMRQYGLKRPPNNLKHVILLEGVSPYLQMCTQKVRPPICIRGVHDRPGFCGGGNPAET